MFKKTFIHNNFLLENSFAEELYHNYASKLPIIDFHCHLSPKDIADNKIFNNLTEAWIYGDHYKWRAMRTLGVAEKYITGNANDEEKFKQWAKTVSYTIRNPLYHWTHLELTRYFDINKLLSANTASDIYEEASEKLNNSSYSCRNLLNKMNVEVVCTTEDPIDTLEHHKKLVETDFNVKVSTSFRPDKAILISDKNFNAYINKLSEISNIAIESYANLCEALKLRIDYFNQNGCKLSDHGLNNIDFTTFTQQEINTIFKNKRSGKLLTYEEEKKFQSAILLFLSEMYYDLGWVQQFHLGALRNNNSKMNSLLGADTGWDSIGDFSQALGLSKFLNTLNSKNKLTKTILYNLNPADNEIFAAMAGNFNEGKIKGKVQYGSAWWFLDQKDGIVKQINALSNMGLLSCFVGMVTDSRSFLSYPRHEYFRRILCNILGTEIQKGELPNDINLIGQIVSDISYNNAKEYFNL